MIGIWVQRNFPCADNSRTVLRCALGVAEESGELAHAILKADQGLRGSVAEHDEAAKDAIGDITIFAMHLCHIKGWDFDAIVRETAARVLRRDWVADARTGGEQ